MLDAIRASSNAQTMALAWTGRISRSVQLDCLCFLKLLSGILAEYQRAIAAVRRYEELQLHCAAALRRHEIPNRIFEEFYAHMDVSFCDPEQSSDAANDNPAYKLRSPGSPRPMFRIRSNTAWSGLQTICHQYGHDLPESPENRYHVRQIQVRPGNPG
jgi:hypothetical protein